MLPSEQTSMPTDWNGVADKSITLATLAGMKFDRTFISVKAGDRVKFTFYNNDDMPHNFVIVKPGKMATVGQAAAALGLQGPALEYVPNSSDVLYHSKLVGPGISETIYFRAPSEAGTYTYVCTFPGHWRSMNGSLRVLP
ncbi:MAG: hypothetical protein HC821_04565 [Lewinella sp.]|nr:hypothetical protein [Lewinella sp.]